MTWPERMKESTLARLADSGIALNSLRLLERVPIPYHRMAVRVQQNEMRAHTLDRFAALWMWKLGLVGTAEIEWAKRLCKPGSFVIDIGANIGVFALILGRCVGAYGHVWAFEPDPDNANMLRRNVESNAMSNVSVIAKAVGSCTASINLYISKIHRGDHRTYKVEGDRSIITVDSIALDMYFSPTQRIDFVKIDVQGSEAGVLQGMQRILRDNAEIKVMMEFWPVGLKAAGYEPAELLYMFSTMGFTLKVLPFKRRAGLRPTNPDDIIQIAHDNAYVNLLASRS